MVDLVVDPVLFAPPSTDDLNKWTARIQDLRKLTASSCLQISCAERSRDGVIALWYSQGDHKDGLSSHELARLAHDGVSRLKGAPSFPEGAPLLDAIHIDPNYIAESMDVEGRGEFAGHLGEAACAKNDGAAHVGVLGPSTSWARDTDVIEVEAELLGRDHPFNGLIETEDENRQLREFLARSDSVESVLKLCCDYPCALLKVPEFGVRALWAAHFDGDPWVIDFEVGPDFGASVEAMGYHQRAGDARRCLRVMAQIAGGQADQVDGHEERETAAPTSPIREDGVGNPVIRSRLQNKVPDAHRLFWARGQRPIFLNVAGHQGGPVI